MTVERQNYNEVVERIWDDRLGGFRPLTEGERKSRTLNRLYRNQDWLKDVKPITASVQ